MDTGSVYKKKAVPSRTTRTLENVESKSRKQSTRKHAAAFTVPDLTVRRILHEDLKIHPYKVAVVQKLNPRDFV